MLIHLLEHARLGSMHQMMRSGMPQKVALSGCSLELFIAQARNCHSDSNFVIIGAPQQAIGRFAWISKCG